MCGLGDLTRRSANKLRECRVNAPRYIRSCQVGVLGEGRTGQRVERLASHQNRFRACSLSQPAPNKAHIDSQWEREFADDLLLDKARRGRGVCTTCARLSSHQRVSESGTYIPTAVSPVESTVRTRFNVGYLQSFVSICQSVCCDRLRSDRNCYAARSFMC